jgi:hypothetical protein
MEKAMRARIIQSVIGLTLCDMYPIHLEAQTALRRDSAEVEIVTSVKPAWPSGRAWYVDRRPLVQIGAPDGEPAYLFSGILDAKLVADSLLAVVDYQAEIRLFDRHGRHIRTIGRRGKGPGEFSNAPVISAAPPDAWVAWDAFSRRLSWFGLDGRLRQEVSLDATAAKTLPMAMGPDAWQLLADGTILSTSSWPERPRSTDREFMPFASKRTVVLWRTSDSSGVTLGEFPSRTGIRFQVPENRQWRSVVDPFSPSSPLALRPDPVRVYVAGSGSWEVREFRDDGSLHRILRASIARSPVTKAIVRQERARLAGSARTLKSDVSMLERAFDAVEFADSTPAISRILYDGDGHLWIARWHADRSTDPTTFDVIDAGGNWLGSVNLPADAGYVTSIGRGGIITIWRDSDDVSYVRIYGVHR